MAVAFVALLAALSGTAAALPGHNTVRSDDIVNGQVKTQDIKNSTVRGKDIRNGTVRGRDVGNGSLTGADIADDSLTGADVNEGSLGTVPNANHANSADSASSAGNANSVGGVVVQPFYRLMPSGTAVADVVSVNGLTLRAGCAGGFLTFQATTSIDNTLFDSNSNDNGTASGDRDSNFDVGDAEDINGANARGGGTIGYARSDGHFVVGTFASDDSNTLGNFDGCVVAGTLQSH